MLGIQCEQTDMASALMKPTVQWGGNHTSNDRITTVMSASSRLKDVGSNPDSTSCHQLCDIRLVLNFSVPQLFSCEMEIALVPTPRILVRIK